MPVGCARVREQLRLTDSNLASYLERIGIIPPGVVSEVEPAGDGNINWVRRLRVASGGAGGRSEATRSDPATFDALPRSFIIS